ncbi:unnamed protein product, partial [Amoebophrya sp. A25]
CRGYCRHFVAVVVILCHCADCGCGCLVSCSCCCRSGYCWAPTLVGCSVWCFHFTA